MDFDETDPNVSSSLPVLDGGELAAPVAMRLLIIVMGVSSGIVNILHLLCALAVSPTVGNRTAYTITYFVGFTIASFFSFVLADRIGRNAGLFYIALVLGLISCLAWLAFSLSSGAIPSVLAFGFELAAGCCFGLWDGVMLVYVAGMFVCAFVSFSALPHSHSLSDDLYFCFYFYFCLCLCLCLCLETAHPGERGWLTGGVGALQSAGWVTGATLWLLWGSDEVGVWATTGALVLLLLIMSLVLHLLVSKLPDSCFWLLLNATPVEAYSSLIEHRRRREHAIAPTDVLPVASAGSTTGGLEREISGAVGTHAEAAHQKGVKAEFVLVYCALLTHWKHEESWSELLGLNNQVGVSRGAHTGGSSAGPVGLLSGIWANRGRTDSAGSGNASRSGSSANLHAHTGPQLQPSSLPPTPSGPVLPAGAAATRGVVATSSSTQGPDYSATTASVQGTGTGANTDVGAGGCLCLNICTDSLRLRLAVVTSLQCCRLALGVAVLLLGCELADQVALDGAISMPSAATALRNARLPSQSDKEVVHSVLGVVAAAGVGVVVFATLAYRHCIDRREVVLQWWPQGLCLPLIELQSQLPTQIQACCVSSSAWILVLALPTGVSGRRGVLLCSLLGGMAALSAVWWALPPAKPSISGSNHREDSLATEWGQMSYEGQCVAALGVLILGAATAVVGMAVDTVAVEVFPFRVRTRAVGFLQSLRGVSTLLLLYALGGDDLLAMHRMSMLSLDTSLSTLRDYLPLVWSLVVATYAMVLTTLPEHAGVLLEDMEELWLGGTAVDSEVDGVNNDGRSGGWIGSRVADISHYHLSVLPSELKAMTMAEGVTAGVTAVGGALSPDSTNLSPESPGQTLTAGSGPPVPAYGTLALQSPTDPVVHASSARGRPPKPTQPHTKRSRKPLHIATDEASLLLSPPVSPLRSSSQDFGGVGSGRFPPPSPATPTATRLLYDQRHKQQQEQEMGDRQYMYTHIEDSDDSDAEPSNPHSVLSSTAVSRAVSRGVSRAPSPTELLLPGMRVAMGGALGDLDLDVGLQQVHKYSNEMSRRGAEESWVFLDEDVFISPTRAKGIADSANMGLGVGLRLDKLDENDCCDTSDAEDTPGSPSHNRHSTGRGGNKGLKSGGRGTRRPDQEVQHLSSALLIFPQEELEELRLVQGRNDSLRPTGPAGVGSLSDPGLRTEGYLGPSHLVVCRQVMGLCGSYCSYVLASGRYIGAAVCAGGMGVSSAAVDVIIWCRSLFFSLWHNNNHHSSNSITDPPYIEIPTV